MYGYAYTHIYETDHLGWVYTHTERYMQRKRVDISLLSTAEKDWPLGIISLDRPACHTSTSGRAAAGHQECVPSSSSFLFLIPLLFLSSFFFRSSTSSSFLKREISRAKKPRPSTTKRPLRLTADVPVPLGRKKDCKLSYFFDIWWPYIDFRFKEVTTTHTHSANTTGIG